MNQSISYALAIYAHPDDPAASLAHHCTAQLLNAGHHIQRLFFYRDGVFNTVNTVASDLPAQWQALIDEHRLDAVVCVTAAAHRGIGDGPDQVPPLAGFDISGLGQLVEAASHCDRFLTFG